MQPLLRAFPFNLLMLAGCGAVAWATAQADAQMGLPSLAHPAGMAVGALLVVTDVNGERARHLGLIAVTTTGRAEMQIRHPLLRRMPIPWPVVGPDIRIGPATHVVERCRPMADHPPVPPIAGLE